MEMNKNISVVIEKSQSESSQVQYSKLSFYELLETVLRQIEFDTFSREDQRQVREIALMIAEMFKLPKTAKVRIGGNDLPASMVADVFDMLTSEHVEYVLEKYNQVQYEIKHTKTYIRTALYNSVSELSLRTVNAVHADGM